MNKLWNTALDIENGYHQFFLMEEEIQDGSDNTKQAEKPFFIVVPTQRKQLKVISTTYGWKL